MSSRLLTLVALVLVISLGQGTVAYGVQARAFGSIEDSVEGFEFDVETDAGFFSAGPADVVLDRVSGHVEAHAHDCKGIGVGFLGNLWGFGFFKDGRGPKHYYYSADCGFGTPAVEGSGHSYIIDSLVTPVEVATLRIRVPMLQEPPFPVEPTPIGDIPIQGLFADGQLEVSLNVNAAVRQGSQTYQSILRGSARLAGPLSSKPGLSVIGDLASAFRETRGQTRNSAVLVRTIEKTIEVKTNEVFEIIMYFHIGTGPHPASPPCDGDCPLLDIPDGQVIGTASSLAVEMNVVDPNGIFTVRQVQ